MKIKCFKKHTMISTSESRLFDFFRGLSAFVILVAHAYQIIIAPSVDSRELNQIIFSIAACAVMVFFFLSGYMIFSSLYRNASINNFQDVDLKKFVIDRLIRLYPPLIFSILVMLLVYIIATVFEIEYLVGDEGYIVREGFFLDSGVLGSLFFIQNVFEGVIPTPSLNASLWSLSHEFWFYIIGALSFKILLPNRRAIYVILLLVLFWVLIAFGRYMPFLLGFFLWGVGGGVCIYHQNTVIKNNRFYLFLSLSIFIISLYAFQSEYLILYFFSKFIFGISFSILIVYLLSLGDKVLGYILKGRVVNYFIASSKFSYTSYVIHWPIYMLIYSLSSDYYNAFPSLIFLVPVVSIYFVIKVSSLFANFLEDKNKVMDFLNKAMMYRNKANLSS